MKTQELTIEAPKGFQIDQEKSTFEKIVFKEISNNFDKIFKYHNTNQEEFDKKYAEIPFHVKAYQKEVMLAAFYNKNWSPNWKNNNEEKHYAWFYMDEFRLNDVDFSSFNSRVPARLCYKNKKDLLEAIELYPDVFKESREF